MQRILCAQSGVQERESVSRKNRIASGCICSSILKKCMAAVPRISISTSLIRAQGRNRRTHRKPPERRTRERKRARCISSLFFSPCAAGLAAASKHSTEKRRSTRDGFRSVLFKVAHSLLNLLRSFSGRQRATSTLSLSDAAF